MVHDELSPTGSPLPFGVAQLVVQQVRRHKRIQRVANEPLLVSCWVKVAEADLSRGENSNERGINSESWQSATNLHKKAGQMDSGVDATRPARMEHVEQRFIKEMLQRHGRQHAALVVLQIGKKNVDDERWLRARSLVNAPN